MAWKNAADRRCAECGAGPPTVWRSTTGDLCLPCDDAYRRRPDHPTGPDALLGATGSLGQPYFAERG